MSGVGCRVSGVEEGGGSAVGAERRLSSCVASPARRAQCATELAELYIRHFHLGVRGCRKVEQRRGRPPKTHDNRTTAGMGWDGWAADTKSWRRCRWWLGMHVPNNPPHTTSVLVRVVPGKRATPSLCRRSSLAAPVRFSALSRDRVQSRGASRRIHQTGSTIDTLRQSRPRHRQRVRLALLPKPGSSQDCYCYLSAITQGGR